MGSINKALADQGVAMVAPRNSESNAGAKTGAQRQAAFRQRAKERYTTGARLNLPISTGAKEALERLARCYCVTQGELLSRLLINAQSTAVETLAARMVSRGEYRDGHARLNFDDL